MVIVALFLFAFGVYWFIARWSRRGMREDDRQFGARVGRSVHAAVPLPGFAGQAPPDFMFEPYKESVGPEESHVLVLDAKGRPVVDDEGASMLGPYRDPDVVAKRGAKGKTKRKTKCRNLPSASGNGRTFSDEPA
jgi:hypothetical protein